MKKIITLLLVAVMCLSFVACNSKSNDGDTESARKEILGTWTTSSDGTLADYTVVFKEDGTGTINKKEIKWKYDNELSCYIVVTASGEMWPIFEISTDDNGARYFKLTGAFFYFQN